MKKFCLIALSLAILTTACALPLVREDYDNWITAQSTPATVDVSGRWDAGGMFAGGWGEANLSQIGRNIIGTIGLYNVTGVVSGSDIYLLFASQYKVYYSAKLSKKPDGSFSGIAISGALADTTKKTDGEIYALNLKRL